MRRFALLALLALAACGAAPRASAPPAEPGVIFAPRFSDADPVDFSGRAPGNFPVHGIDAARFQKSIDWNTARRNGVNFAFIKATEGGDLLDLEFKNHWRGAARAGVERGAYHFYYFCTSPEVQARWFIRNVPRGNMLPPVLDMEWNPFSPTCATVRPPAAEVRRQMRTWLRIVTDHYGQKPIIYTTPKFYRENDLRRMTGWEFWLRSTAKQVSDVYPGERWTFWQYTATGIVPGILGEVDLNVFAGNRAEWQRWVAARKR
ncbi:glycoside hydrolase [Sulfitobacter sp. TSTF-M16]|uniref:Glycoside hydrolase n=2 Tax=Sulfitobacter aestuariivivens TaxID=2766981 RepID=A0A927D486_9RHOB|nr:GH25 family lysozyme [Sulfitobacter aestuariivivens]MBD3664071.1 glycoside hydrolase [Sulfitobacter aestuariivivens]